MVKVPIGPHKRAAIRRRRLKAVVIGVVVVCTMLSASLMLWEPPEPEKQVAVSELVYMRNVAKYSPGHARAYVEMYPDLAEYILGQKEIPLE